MNAQFYVDHDLLGLTLVQTAEWTSHSGSISQFQNLVSTNNIALANAFVDISTLRKLIEKKYKYLAHVAILRGFSSYYLNDSNAN